MAVFITVHMGLSRSVVDEFFKPFISRVFSDCEYETCHSTQSNEPALATLERCLIAAGVDWG